MNYQHIFHAGSFADVFKHSILTLILEYLSSKDKGFCFIDTHAGLGDYDLNSVQAQRSLEYKEGIAKLLAAKTPPAELSRYLTIAKGYMKDGYYPGSPLIAEQFLRAADQMILNEYHPEIFPQLKQALGKKPNIHYHQRNAYEFLPALLPPTPRRGVILIDPPYENTAEFAALIDMITLSLKRFANGIYLIWYPIVTLQHRVFLRQISQLKLAPMLNCELMIAKESPVKTGLIGCGVLIINPPWQIETKITPIADYLCKLFRKDTKADYSIQLHSIE